MVIISTGYEMCYVNKYHQLNVDVPLYSNDFSEDSVKLAQYASFNLRRVTSGNVRDAGYRVEICRVIWVNGIPL